MVTGEKITRRAFLDRLMKAAAGAGLYAFIPVSLPSLKPSLLEEDIRPYWLEVLSKGIGYFPQNIISFFSTWSSDQFLESSQYALLLTLNQNKRLLTSEKLPPDREMDQITESNKTTQYIFSILKNHFLEQNAGPDITYGNDPFHARLLYDMSSFMLRDIIEGTEDTPDAVLDDFDINLLNSCASYLEEAIRMSEHSFILCDDSYKDILIRNIGSYYNNLGLTLSYLGDNEKADQVFRRALEFRPDDDGILRNMHELNSNTMFHHKKTYSHLITD